MASMGWLSSQHEQHGLARLRGPYYRAGLDCLIVPGCIILKAKGALAVMLLPTTAPLRKCPAWWACAQAPKPASPRKETREKSLTC
jgi:hypothetical protein